MTTPAVELSQLLVCYPTAMDFRDSNKLGDGASIAYGSTVDYRMSRGSRLKPSGSVFYFERTRLGVLAPSRLAAVLQSNM